MLQQRFLKSRGLGPIKTKTKSKWALSLNLHQMIVFFRKWPIQQCLVVRNLGRICIIVCAMCRCEREGAHLSEGQSTDLGLGSFLPRWIQGIELKLAWAAPLPAEPFSQSWFLSFTWEARSPSDIFCCFAWVFEATLSPLSLFILSKLSDFSGSSYS